MAASGNRMIGSTRIASSSELLIPEMKRAYLCGSEAESRAALSALNALLCSERAALLSKGISEKRLTYRRLVTTPKPKCNKGAP